MTYQVKDMVFQRGSYYFLLENNIACTPVAQGYWEIWLDGQPIDGHWEFALGSDFSLPDNNLLVLQAKAIPPLLKRWKRGKQTLMLKAGEGTLEQPVRQPKRYATRLERHKNKWWIFTWYD